MEKKALIVYHSSYGQTAKVSDFIADILKKANYTVDVIPVERKNEIKNISSFDPVILGCPVYANKHSKLMSAFIRENLPELQQTNSAFFSVSLAVQEKQEEHAKHVMNNFLRECNWNPNHTAAFGGALHYSKYWFGKRWMMHKICKNNGLQTVTSQDYEFTDWDQVNAFAEQVQNK